MGNLAIFAAKAYHFNLTHFMKKNILLVTLMCLVTVASVAGPARKGVWKSLRLEDGSEVRAELQGDEFGHFWSTEDGARYVEAREGGLYEEASLESIVERASMMRQAMTGRTAEATRSLMRRVVVGGDHDPYVGSKKCLIILANFADVKFEADHDWDYYNRMANEIGFSDSSGNIASVRDYFLDQSYGQLDISFDVVGPVDLANGYAYYGGDNLYRHAHEMAREACAYAEAQGIDFSLYDWDGDGEVEQVYVIYAGHGAADWTDQDTVWPHTSFLEQTSGGKLLYDGVYINTYACSCELSGKAVSGKADGIGSMCHEFSHCMGLPDMYDTSYINYGMCFWDLMDSGSYNGSNCGYIPAGYTSYERMYCGWLDPVELTEETQVDGMRGLTEGGEAYIVYNGSTRDEYYLLENRVLSGFDSGLYGDGLLILHVDFNSNIWALNMVNTTGYGNTHERCTVIPSDNDFEYTSSGIAGDAWPNNGNKKLDNTTTPAATAWNANTDREYYMNVSISGIRKMQDGTISFRFYPAGTDPNHGNPPEGNVFYESFDDCGGTGGNDGVFGSSIVTGTFYADNDGWECNSAHGCDECAIFGSNNTAANVLTPPFTIDGETTFTFKAAPLQAIVPGMLVISAETAGITLSETEFSIGQGEWTTCSLTLGGSGDVRLRIKETSGLNRFFMDEVAAVPASAGITAVPGDAVAARRGVYTLDGIYLGEDDGKLKKGIYIIDGSKRVIR